MGSIDILLIKKLGDVYAKIREAGRLIKVTSPYIDHMNPQTILAVAEANPEHVRKLIFAEKFYGQFMPLEMIPDAYREQAESSRASEASTLWKRDR